MINQVKEEPMLTKQLADFSLSISFENLPEDVVELAKMCVQDLIGVSIASSNHEQAAIWKSYFSEDAQAPRATVWNAGFPSLDRRQTAALNSALGHLLELDDLHNSSIAHLGTVTIPAAFSIGQALSKNGPAVIEAIVAGYEVGARIGETVNPASYKFWHTTGIVGSFCSCMAAGKLMGLDGAQMLNALGSAGTQSAGLWEFLNSGAMSKPLHTANAALCGLRAADLAKRGLTGADRILEGKRGLVSALAETFNINALTEGLGVLPYKLSSNSFKPYACCRHAHSGVYCIEKIREEHPLEPQLIVKILDKTYKIAADHVDEPAPATLLAHKFSMQYCIAGMIAYGQLMESEFTTERVASLLVRGLMGKVTVAVDDEFETAYREDPSRWPHQVEITMNDGAILTKRVDYPLGDWRNPFDWEMADKKFYTVTKGVIPDEQAQILSENIKKLETFDDINQVFRLRR